MSNNRFDALSSSDSGSPNKRRERKLKKQMDSNDDGEFDPRVLSCLRYRKWRTFDGKLVDKDVMKKYLDEVEKSEGFDITHFPGVVYGVTNIRPYSDLTTEEYDKIMELTTTAMKEYNSKNVHTFFKVTEIKKVNWTGGVRGSYYITFEAVNVKGDSVQAPIFRSFVAASLITFVTILTWLTVFLPPYNKTAHKLCALLLKLKSAPELKASASELNGRTAHCFQAKVWDHPRGLGRKVLVCRARA